MVIDLVVKGHTNAEIATLRDRSLETINSQLKALILKSGTRNRTELVRLAFRSQAWDADKAGPLTTAFDTLVACQGQFPIPEFHIGSVSQGRDSRRPIQF